MYDRILVPLDGSELAEQALPVAEKALNPGGELLLCRVLLSGPMLGWEPIPVESMLEKERALAQEYLDSVGHKLSAPVRKLVQEGPVPEAILNAIENEGVELVVLSSHGRSGASRWFLGSVAERLVRVARCPVLVCKSQ